MSLWVRPLDRRLDCLGLPGQDAEGLACLWYTASGLSLSPGRLMITLGRGEGSNPTGFPAPWVELLFLRVRRCWLHLFQLVPVPCLVHLEVALRILDQELGQISVAGCLLQLLEDWLGSLCFLISILSQVISLYPAI